MHWYLVVTPLLAGGDEGASFFADIYHIQAHRRTRALRQLSEFLDTGVLSSRTLVDMFVHESTNCAEVGVIDFVTKDELGTVSDMVRCSMARTEYGVWCDAQARGGVVLVHSSAIVGFRMKRI